MPSRLPLNPRPGDEFVVPENQPEFAVMKHADAWGDFLHLVRFAHEVQHLLCAGTKFNHFRALSFLRDTSTWRRLRHGWHDWHDCRNGDINGTRNRRRRRLQLLVLYRVENSAPQTEQKPHSKSPSRRQFHSPPEECIISAFAKCLVDG